MYGIRFLRVSSKHGFEIQVLRKGFTEKMREQFFALYGDGPTMVKMFLQSRLATVLTKRV